MQFLLDHTLKTPLPIPNRVILGDASYYVDHKKSYTTVVNLNDDYPFPKTINNPNTEYYTKKYNNFHMHTWVIAADPFSYQSAEINKYRFVNLLCHYFIYAHIIDQSYDILCVFQDAHIKGLHCHFNILSTVPLKTDTIEALTNLLNKKIKWTVKHEDGTIINEDIHFISNYEKIKSTGSYINYLQSKHKGTFYTTASSQQILDMFCCFNKDLIFQPGTVAKKQRYINNNVSIQSDNNLVIFLMKKLHTGTSNYNELLKDINIQSYLHIPNLKTIWENCYHQFSASLSHTDNVKYIIQKITELKTEELCACGLMDLLMFQNVSPRKFGQDLIKWLFGWEKRNVLLLLGPHNCGKSYFARMLWNFFLLKQRIVNDGIFSFANAPGSGCLLWEETHIPPELADIAKLIMEGEPTVAVTIKNQPSRLLGKRIPLLITNNHPLGVFCSNEQINFDARCFKFTFNNEIQIQQLCNNTMHYCDRLDAFNNTPTKTRCTPGQEVNSTLSEVSVEDCTKFHKLSDHHILSFIALAISDNFTEIHLKESQTIIDLCRLIETKADSDICASSKLNYD